MNVVLFRPLDGDPNILVATLSGPEASAAAIVTRTPAQDPSWPSTWSYQIAGDVSRATSDPYSNEQAAMEAAAWRLCHVLGVRRLDWLIDRSDEAVEHWGVGTSEDDPVLPIVFDFRPKDTAAQAAAILDAMAPERPDPTRVTRTGVVGPSLRARLRGVWKAWRL